MHFQCLLSDLNTAINLVEKAVAVQDNIPIITGIHILADNDLVTLTATNLELGIQSKLPAHVTKKNEIVVDGKLLAALVKKLPKEPVIFQLEDKQLIISAGTVEYALNTLTNEDFPELPKTDNIIFEISGEKLLDMIKNTIYACGKDDQRPFLNGILFEFNDNQLNLVATDINRLSYYTFELEHNFSDQTLIVPMKTLLELQRILPNDESKIQVAFIDNYLIFKHGHTTITTQLIDDRFPKYQGLFPKDEPIKIIVNRQILISAMERAALVGSDDGKQIVILDAVDGVLEISTPSTTRGKSEEKINVEHEGENGKAAFSVKYILDMLKASDSELILFNFNSDLRQCLMKSYDQDDHKYILMPIRLN